MISVFTETVFVKQTHFEDSFRTDLAGFVIIHEGSIVIELNELETQYKSGHVIPISPKNLYKLKSFSNDLKAYVVAVDPNFIREKVSFNFNRYDVYRMARIENGANLLFFNERETVNLVHLAEQLHFFTQQEKEASFRQEIILSIFATLIYILLGRLLENIKTIVHSNPRKQDITMKFMELIPLNYRSERELKFYADQLFISVKYLSNCVREVTTFPPTKFIADAVLNDAKILLLNSKNTIRMIADELGFSDQYSFGKFFKKHTGYSPKNFKIKNKLVDTF